MGLEDLTNVHSRRHAERVEHNVNRPSIGKERHILLGHDAGDDTLVAVASRHLVADRDLALLGEVDLHELNDARRQLVRLENPVDPLLRPLLDARLLFGGRVDDLSHPLVLRLFSTRSVFRSIVESASPSAAPT